MIVWVVLALLGLAFAGAMAHVMHRHRQLLDRMQTEQQRQRALLDSVEALEVLFRGDRPAAEIEDEALAHFIAIRAIDNDELAPLVADFERELERRRAR
jgi:heme exporter protein D